MKSAALFLAGLLIAPAGFAQDAYVQWGNTATTPVFTNNCAGTIGLVSGSNAYRFGLYVGPLGTPVSSLTIVALATNNPTIPGRFGTQNPTLLPVLPFPAGVPLTIQVRGWTASAFSFEQALQNGDFPIGVSDLGYFTPSDDPLTAPSIFGDGPGQIGGFELTCLDPPLSTRRLAPDGPIIITRALPNSQLTWTNVTAFATYVVQAATAVTGPWTNFATITGTTFQTTYTLPASADGLRFYRVVWTNAPPPQNVGTWDYQAFDSAGTVMAAGVFRFTSNVPSTVSFNFSRIQTLAQNSDVLLHPQGLGTMSASSVGSSNTIELFFNNEFRLRGQMVPISGFGFSDGYFAGDWFATDYIINPPPGGPLFIIHSGRFLALRRYSILDDRLE